VSQYTPFLKIFKGIKKPAEKAGFLLLYRENFGYILYREGVYYFRIDSKGRRGLNERDEMP